MRGCSVQMIIFDQDTWWWIVETNRTEDPLLTLEKESFVFIAPLLSLEEASGLASS